MPRSHQPSIQQLPYSLKFSRVKIFEDFEDFCLTSKILISKILVLQGRLLKIIFYLLSLYKFFKRESVLPKPSGALSRVIPSSCIEAANKTVKDIAKSSLILAGS